VDNINSSYDPGGQVLRQQPDLVIIHIGTNDVTQSISGAWVGGSIALSITNLSTLLTTIFANKSDTIVCVCKIIPNRDATNDAGMTSWNSSMATMVAAHANASRIFTADCNTAFKNDATWATDYMNDDTHPNSAGESVMATTIQTAIQTNISLMPRTTASFRRSIKPHTASLQYTASTDTTLGTGTTLDTTLPWAVSMDIDLSLNSVTTNKGLWILKTDQATAFWMLVIGSNERYVEFGSNANFDRFFPNNSISPNTREKMFKGWHNVVLTFDGVDRTADTSYKLYIDAQSITLTNGSGLAGSTNKNAIGSAVSGGAAGTFDMADFTVWNGGSAMTAAQVQDWYSSYILPTGPTLIRRYQHTDGSGATLTDSTGNQNGTIGTATWITSSLPTMNRKSLDTARTTAAARTTAV
jgi:hypothetical protein